MRIALALLLFVSFAVAAEDKRPLPWAVKDVDQSFTLGLGFHKNGGRGVTTTMTYKHPLAQWLKAFFSLDRVWTEEPIELDTTAAIAGISVYPLKNRLYFDMGLGAEKAGPETQSLFSAALGYELDFHRLWFVDGHVTGDWDKSGNGRWAVLIGVGKRF